MNQVAIGLSVILSFLTTEFLGLATGGMISAGYLALFLQSPFRIIATLICSVAVWAVILFLQKFIIIYGRRRFVLSILLGFTFTFVWSKVIPLTGINMDIRIVGYIIPGLIANDMVRQGVFKTIGALLIVSFVVKLILLLGMAI